MEHLQEIKDMRRQYNNFWKNCSKWCTPFGHFYKYVVYIKKQYTTGKTKVIKYRERNCMRIEAFKEMNIEALSDKNLIIEYIYFFKLIHENSDTQKNEFHYLSNVLTYLIKFSTFSEDNQKVKNLLYCTKILKMASEGAKSLKSLNPSQRYENSIEKTISGKWPTRSELKCFFIWIFQKLHDMSNNLRNNIIIKRKDIIDYERYLITALQTLSGGFRREVLSQIEAKDIFVLNQVLFFLIDF